MLPIVLNKALTFGETVKYSHNKVFYRHLTRESSRHCSKLQVNSWGMFIEVDCRVAELGSLLLGAKIAMKIFVTRVFTIFATNALFLHVIVNLLT